MIVKLSAKVKQNMVLLFNTLSEKDRRRYAGVEAQKLGYGGVGYIAALFNCDEKTIRRGCLDLANDEAMSLKTIRASGGGRISKLEHYEGIDQVFLEVLKNHTAGNPMKQEIKWTNLTKAQIMKKIAARGIVISKNLVKKLLKRNGFVKRKMQKSKATSKHQDRNQQFEKIFEGKENCENEGVPVISVDSKKAEKIGDLHRGGSIECLEALQAFDHDFPSLASGELKLYSVYDIKNNEAFVNIGTSNDTSEYACDTIALWWNILGKKRYPSSQWIMCLADGGGSNASRSDLFKEALQNIANKLKLDIQVSHYPPGTSKWNPIEHRVFPHITRALSGVMLNSVNLAKDIIKSTTTKTGLKVFVRMSYKFYETGRKVAEDYKECANIIHDKVLGQWNYAVMHEA